MSVLWEEYLRQLAEQHPHMSVAEAVKYADDPSLDPPLMLPSTPEQQPFAGDVAGMGKWALQQPAVREFILNKKWIQAIKEIRTLHHAASLKDAKDAMEWARTALVKSGELDWKPSWL